MKKIKWCKYPEQKPKEFHRSITVIVRVANEKPLIMSCYFCARLRLFYYYRFSAESMTGSKRYLVPSNILYWVYTDVLSVPKSVKDLLVDKK